MKKDLKLDLPPADSLVDQIFTTQEQRDDAKREKVMDIPLSEIDPFPNHPFLVKHDEAMQNMVESVKTFGIQTPAIVRQKDDGRYELISGHRRKMASEIVGQLELPCIIRKLSDSEATIAMVDANLQRETILPSEKAKSYKMRLDAMNKQGKRTDLTYSPVGNKLSGKTSSAELADTVGESKNQIFRYVRLNELIPQLLEMVDNSVVREKSLLQIAMRPAVELSYIPAKQQKALLDEMLANDNTPSHDQAIKLRKFADAGKLDESVIKSIMQEAKPNQVEHFKMPKEKLSKYFPPDVSIETIEDTIVRALEMLRQKERNRSRDAR